MSMTVDERVVEMQFDNAKFEKNANETIRTLNRLNASLDLQNSAKSFNELSKAANSVDISGLEKSFDAITERVSMLGIIGDQVIRNFTTKIVNAGERMVRSLSIDQITKGFDKYASKTESVQTIMNATGKDINTVNNVLTRLNQYTDETSYNFTDMVSSIGKFTSAGVDLEVAETAMEGIANWAAKAGIGPERAAGAFYNLSQAIGSGALKLQDWKSIENLSMGTRDVKEQFIEAGLAAGTLVRAGDKIYTKVGRAEVTVNNFRDSLQKGWITSDVLISTMQKYADTTTEFGLQAFKSAQEAKTFKDAIDAVKDAVSTGWMNIFEQIFGNYEEARVLWTQVANELIEVFTKPTNALNKLLKKWHELGGYTAFVEALSNSWESLKSVVEAVKEVFAEIFPGLTPERLVEATEWVRNLTERWKDFTTTTDKTPALLTPKDLRRLREAGEDLSEYEENLANIDRHNQQVEKNLAPLKATVQGIFSVLKLIGTAIGAIFKIAAPLLTLISPVARLLGAIASGIGNLLTRLTELIANSRIVSAIVRRMERFSSGIARILGLIVDKFASLIQSIQELPIVQAFIGALTDLIAKVKTLAGPYIDKIKQKIDGFLDKLDEVDESDLVNFFEEVISTLIKIGYAIVMVGQAIAQYLAPYWEEAKTKLAPVIAWISAKIEEIRAEIEESGLWAFIVAKATWVFDKIKLIVGQVTSFIQSGGLTRILDLVREKIVGLWNAIRNLDFANIMSKAFSVAKIAGVVAGLIMLWRATKSIQSISAFLEDFPAALKSFTKGLGLKRLAVSIFILAAAMWMLASIPTGKLYSLAGVIAILGGVLVGFTLILTAVGGLLSKENLVNNKGLKQATKTMLALAVAILLLAVAMKKLDEIDDIEKGIKAILFLAGIIVAATLALSFAGKGVKALGIGLLALTVAIAGLMYLFSKVQGYIAEVGDNQELLDIVERFGIILAAIIAAIAVLVFLVGRMKNASYAAALSVAAIGVTFYLVAEAIEGLMDHDWEDLAKGGVALLGITLAIGILLVVLANLPEGASDNLSAVADIIKGIGEAILMLVAAVWVLAKIDAEELTTGLLRLLPIVMIAVLLMLAAGASASMGVADGGGFKGIAVMLVAIVGSLWALTLIDPAKLLWSVLMLSAVLIAVGGMLALGSKALEGANAGPFVGLMLIILVIGGVLLALSNLTDPESLFVSVVALSATLFALGIGMRLAGNSMSDVKVGTLVGMALMLAVVAGALIWLATFPAENVIAAAGGLAVAILAISLAMLIISAATKGADFKTVGVTALMMIAILVPVVAALIILDKMTEDPTRLVTYVMALVPLLLALTLVMVAVAVIGAVSGGGAGLIGGALGFVAGLVILLAGLAGIIWAIDAIVGDNGALVIEKINKVSEILEAIGHAFGSIVGGFLAGMTDGLPQIADNLATFMERLTPALDAFSGLEVDEGKANAISALAGALLKLTAAELLDGITQWLTGSADLPTFAESIGQLGPALKTFAEETEGIDADSVGNAATAVEALVGVAKKMPRQGGLLQRIVGETQSLGDFARELKRAAPALLEFASVSPGIARHKQDFLDAAESLEALVKVANALKPESMSMGWGAYVEEAQSLGDFAEQLADQYGEGSAQGVRRTKGIGTNLAEFAESISGIGERTGDLDAAATALEKLVSIAGILTTEEATTSFGIFSHNTSTSSGLGTMLEDLAEYGPNLVTFVDMFSGDQLQKLERTANVFRLLTHFVTSIAGDDGSETVGYQLSTFIGALSSSVGEMYTMSFLAERINYDALSSLFDYMVAITQERMDFTTWGEEAIVNMVEAMTEMATDKAESTAIKISNKISWNLRKTSTIVKYRNAGVQSAMGFINGFMSQLTNAANAGTTLAETTIQALRRALRIESPSKEFEEAGEDSAEGYVGGLSKWNDRAATASEELAESVMESVMSVLDYIQGILSGELAVDLTIRPVLDLTNIRQGAGTINGLITPNTLHINGGFGGIAGQNGDIAELIAVNREILHEIQNGSDIYLDGKVLASRLNRRLGQL